MWQKLNFKIKTSMKRASEYFIHPALCISSLDLGGLLFPFQKLQMSFYFWDSVYSPSYNLIFRHQSSGNGWKQMNTSYDHDSSILSWNFRGSPRCIATRWHDRFQLKRYFLETLSIIVILDVEISLMISYAWCCG